MMEALYYDRDGRPVSRQRWQQLGRQPGYSRIGHTDATRYGQQVIVITFWSGVAGDGPDGPLIFCTYAGIRRPGSQGPAGFLTGHTNQLPAPDPALPGAPRGLGGERTMDDSLIVAAVHPDRPGPPPPARPHHGRSAQGHTRRPGPGRPA